MISEWENTTESPTFAINHLHTLKTRAEQSSDASTQPQHKPAGGQLEKPFLHPLLLQSSFSITLCSREAGEQGREGQGKEQSHGMGWAQRKGRDNQYGASRQG